MIDQRLVVLGEKIHDSLVDSFDHNPIWYSRTLAGACAVGSLFFKRTAKKKLGLNVKFAACEYHAWIEYDKVIYDCTATQFGCPDKVVAVHHKDIFSLAWQELIDAYSDGKNYTLADINTEWPDSQQPKNFTMSWLNEHKAKIYFTRKNI